MTFKVFCNIERDQTPDFKTYGLEPLRVVDILRDDNGLGESWRPRNEDDRRKLELLLPTYNVNDRLFVIDLEVWHGTTVWGQTAEQVKQNIADLDTLARWCHELQPGLRLGYYSIPPVHDYWRTLPTHHNRADWLKENAALKPLAAEVDVLFPSIYAFYPDRSGWLTYAKAQIAEAKKYGKQVYPFLWPQYHDSTFANLHWIEPDFWRHQLETCLQLADGCVVWDWFSSDDRAPSYRKWNPEDPWWIVLRAFMLEHGL